MCWDYNRKCEKEVKVGESDSVGAGAVKHSYNAGTRTGNGLICTWSYHDDANNVDETGEINMYTGQGVYTVGDASFVFSEFGNFIEEVVSE